MEEPLPPNPRTSLKIGDSTKASVALYVVTSSIQSQYYR